MGAARYVGRVGGLAIALGVGTAILTGQGLAYADDTDASPSASSSAETGPPASSTHGDTVTLDKRPVGKHRTTDGTTPADTVEGIVDRVAGERENADIERSESTDTDDADTEGSENADTEGADTEGNESADAEGADTEGNESADADSAPSRSSERRKHNGVTDERESTPPQQDSQLSTEAPDTIAVADPSAQQSSALSWLKSSQVVAGREAREVEAAPTTGSSLWTPPGALATDDSEVVAPTPPSTTLVGDLLASVNQVLNPDSSNDGTAPVGGSLSDLLLLAGARREMAQVQTLAIPPYSVEVAAGVIGGCVVGTTCTTPDGSTYTVIDDPSKGGKLTLDATTGAFRFLPYTAEQSTKGPSGVETFSVLVAQNTTFTTFVTGLPIIGATLIAPIIQILQQAHIFSGLIGTAERRQIDIDITALRGVAETPVAYTTFVTSWDKTQISVNFFPALATGAPDDGVPGAETIFNGPGLAQAGATDPNDPFVKAFRAFGYNVVTWDPRGEFASGGVLQLDSPQYEGQDVQQLISWVATQDGVELDDAATKDPRMGMVGVSYGGGIQLVTAASDPRVDAIAPGWAWNTLPDSLYPHNAFRTSYSALLLLGLVQTGARINPMIYGGILTGATLGILTPAQIQLLQNSGPGQTVRNINVPTLLFQGTVDVLFPLQQSILNMGYLAANPNVKLLWFCGGHGTCLPDQGNGDADSVWTLTETVKWMQHYVKDLGPADPNAFEWTDQNGDRWTSTVRPTADEFYDAESKVLPTLWNTGKTLPIIPIIGGSGPSPDVDLPYSLGDGSVATNAVSIDLNNPASGEANVVGAPHVVINYSGLGTSRHIYAQVVDKSTGLVVGNIVSPIPVTLNGRDQTVEIDLEDIAYTMTPHSELELQIFTTATPFLNLTQFGFVHIDSVEVSLPTTSKGSNQGPNPLPIAV
ncbi:CocE/NonD family hydrolase [Mycolicibacterium psychrotolerans]|uniref:Xaa-Pro dipeptidyl-peptidase C-terminal domain-containing protein n=1 Tax=Mycolicibacterium psychrotolerans TaxID=216929 RepID=A0A7I7MAP7_9MYCO|nr:CocE/NonD family hydrolase [Mycolicibacterium psychrotolerans]BBX69284.1 hypothetical protein MPSYJ_27450 [Mycolicibacterium psychrotolerans]